jgi:hypothetical protein
MRLYIEELKLVVVNNTTQILRKCTWVQSRDRIRANALFIVRTKYLIELHPSRQKPPCVAIDNVSNTQSEIGLCFT